MPAGTRFADFANTHNYLIANGFKQPANNNAWGAAAPRPGEGPYDGLYPEYGRTWHKRFMGYSVDQLQTLPRVSTETGWFTQGNYAVSEAQQGKLFLNLDLAQYKRGWRYTFIYMLKDDPNQGYWGLFHTDYTPKLSATYLHNLTTILADKDSIAPGSLDYSIPAQPATVHDLLIQKSNGSFELAVWDENVAGTDNVTVNLGRAYATVKIYDPTLGTSPTKDAEQCCVDPANFERSSRHHRDTSPLNHRRHLRPAFVAPVSGPWSHMANNAGVIVASRQPKVF
jgi:hypothetical protein